MTRRKTKTSAGLSNPKSKVNITLTAEANNTLNAIAKELGVTKSGLLEQILVGDIAMVGKSAEKQVSLIDDINEQGSFFDGVEIFSRDNLTSSVSSNDNQEYLGKIQNLEETINSQRDTVAEKLKINHALQEELETKNILIKSLQDDLLKIQKAQKSTVNDEEVNNLRQQLSSLKNELTAEKNQLSSLNKELANNQQKLSSLQDNISSLNQQLTEKEKQVNDLQKDLANQQNLVVQKENALKELHSKSALHREESSNLQQQLMEKEKQINNLKNNLEEVKNQTDLNQGQLQKQIAEYQLKINEKEQEKIALSQNLAKGRRALEDSLLTENQQQKLLINNLYNRISDLELYASFGEKMLNKWRK